MLSANFQVASQIFQNICLQVCMKNAQLYGFRPFHSIEYAMYDICLGGFFTLQSTNLEIFLKIFI